MLFKESSGRPETLLCTDKTKDLQVNSKRLVKVSKPILITVHQPKNWRRTSMVNAITFPLYVISSLIGSRMHNSAHRQ